MKHTVGIDFGTTNSAVAVYFPDNGMVMSGDYEPTVIYFEESRDQIFHVGKEALRRYVAMGLKGRFIRSIKSVLHHKSFRSTMIYGRKYLAEDLVALYLSHLVDTAEKITGVRPEKVVMGRPAAFSPDPKADALAENRLLKAAQLAGFKEVSFQLEPIAAAFSYESKIQKNELVFVGDFGGGTSDFTLMRLGPDKGNANRRQDIVGSAGVRVGGDDFDAELAWGKVVRKLGYGLEYDSTGRGKFLPVPPHHYREFCRWENHFRLNTTSTIIELEKYFAGPTAIP